MTCRHASGFSAHGHGVIPVLLLVAVALCCGSPGDAGIPAQSQPTEAAVPLYLEFDLPDAFWTKTPDGADLVTGFRVGYFREGENAMLLTSDYPRDEVTVNGSTGRVALRQQKFPGRGSDFTVRIQTLTRSMSSIWSDPSETRDDLVTFVAARPNAARVPRRILSLADVEKHERLFVELKKTLSATAKPQQVLSAFGQIDQLAVAVVLCRDNRIRLDELAEAMIGPPRRPLSRAVLEVEPKLARSALQNARITAKQLLGR